MRFAFAPPPAPAVYPDAPGWKEPTTSREAAAKIDAGTLRAEVLDWLRNMGPHTPDETAEGLKRSVLAIRPRFTELRKGGLIEKDCDRNGFLTRRRNLSGMRAQVWRIRR